MAAPVFQQKRPRHFAIIVTFLFTLFIFVSYRYVDTGLRRPTLVWNNVALHDKWIVVTSVAQPTADVKFLAALSGWKVVVVADTKTPANWSYPNVTLLSMTMQQQLGFATFDLLPTRNYARKNMGYLYAILHGAQLIYETDDDNRPLDLLKDFTLEPRFRGLAYVGDNLFNPYRHFGQSSLWPRGYPLNKVGSVPPNKYLLGKWDTPAIQQGLVNGDPDMDAVFRLTRKLTQKALNVTFDSKAPNVMLPAGVFAPFNSQNTLFHYEALWAMVLPTTVTLRVTDIWRGYWAQRLMWEIGGTLGFWRANAFQVRNAHDYLVDAEEEKKLIFQTPELLAFLGNWTCPAELKFFDCVVLLSQQMAENGYWGDTDVSLVKAWLSDLLTIGYRSPERLPLNDSQPELLKHFNGKPLTGELPFDPETHRARVIFHALEMPPPLIESDTNTQMTDAEHLKQLLDLQRICSNATFKIREEKDRQRLVQPDILLVSEFNKPFYEAIPTLETNNRHFYPHHLYCGQEISRFLNSPAASMPVTFVEASVRDGYFGYECTVHAINMGYHDIKAYFYLSEDVLVQQWLWNASYHNNSWILNAGFMDIQKTTWTWIRSKWGSGPANKALADLANISRTDDRVRDILKKFRENHSTYVKTLNYSLFFSAGMADVYVVNSKDAQDFQLIGGYFRKYGTFLEVTVAFIMSGLYPANKLQHLMGINIWTDRQNMVRHYNATYNFLHPVKWRLVLASPAQRAVLCQHYYKKLEDLV